MRRLFPIILVTLFAVAAPGNPALSPLTAGRTAPRPGVQIPEPLAKRKNLLKIGFLGALGVTLLYLGHRQRKGH